MISESEVLQALRLACSQEPEIMTVGEKQLESWKTEKNFCATLAVRKMHDEPFMPSIVVASYPVNPFRVWWALGRWSQP